jgi:hypothetical protein
LFGLTFVPVVSWVATPLRGLAGFFGKFTRPAFRLCM